MKNHGDPSLIQLPTQKLLANKNTENRENVATVEE